METPIEDGLKEEAYQLGQAMASTPAAKRFAFGKEQGIQNDLETHDIWIKELTWIKELWTFKAFNNDIFETFILKSPYIAFGDDQLNYQSINQSINQSIKTRYGDKISFW